MEQNTCNKCGRPIQYATETKCNYCDSCMSEYCGCKLGRIKEMEPTCDSTAVIPSITVESVEGITNLANCLVHVEDTNTTYYIDDKHRIMITWAGPVNIPGYDMKNNPNKYKNQIVTDVENETAVIYDEHGKGYIFGITSENLQQAVNDKLDEMAADGTLENIIAGYIDGAILGFDTVADMKNANSLIDGSYAKTLGYYTKNDGGGATYKIRAKTDSDTTNDQNLIAIGSTLVAEICLDGKQISVKQFGAKGNNTDDDSALIQATIDYATANNITDVYMPKGQYKITTPIVLYNFVNLKGENRENTIIVKTGHATDSINNQDCVLTATKKAGDTLNYPRYIEIDNICLESDSHSDQPAYGLYLNTSSFITITHFASRHTGCCIYLGDMWLSTLKEVSTGYGTIGLRTRAGTTLSINDTYTAGNSQYGYYIQGLSYSMFANMACDSAPNSEAYYFYYSNVNVNGLGCEASNATCDLHLQNSQIVVSNATLRTNETNAESSVLTLQNGGLTISGVVGAERSGGVYVSNGNFVEFVGTGSHLTLNNIKVFTRFATANVNTSDRNVISYIDKDNFTNTLSSTRGFIGSRYPLYDDESITSRLNLPTLQSQLSEPCCHLTNNNYDNVSIAYAHDNRPMGAIIPNVGLNRSGTVMFIKSSESKVCELVNPISNITLDGNSLILSFSTLTLDALAEYRMDKISNKWRVRKKNDTTLYTITAVDYENNTITITATGGFTVGEYIDLLPPRDVRDCSFTPVQGLLKGTTANRPLYPQEGTMYFDTTIGKPVWRVGNRWVDSTGTTA